MQRYACKEQATQTLHFAESCTFYSYIFHHHHRRRFRQYDKCLVLDYSTTFYKLLCSLLKHTHTQVRPMLKHFGKQNCSEVTFDLLPPIKIHCFLPDSAVCMVQSICNMFDVIFRPLHLFRSLSLSLAFVFV